MAARLRMVHVRKRASKRPAARKKRTRRLRILALAGLTALILGFLAKRVMIPSALHYIAYRPPDHPLPPEEANPPGDSERLTPADRRELDSILKEKNKP